MLEYVERLIRSGTRYHWRDWGLVRILYFNIDLMKLVITVHLGRDGVWQGNVGDLTTERPEDRVGSSSSVLVHLPAS